MNQIANTKHYDVVIIGAGVLGLWAARHAIKRGEKVALVEKREIGAGASGGFLGALMPHMPDNWNSKKQFQFDGLSSLPDAITGLETDTGFDCGYRRCGRAMPIPHEKLLKQIDRRLDGAVMNWGERFSLDVVESGSQQIDPDISKFGVQYDTLSARINPRAYVNALAAFAKPNCDMIIGSGVKLLQAEPSGVSIVLENMERISAARCIVANGYEAYPLLQPYMMEMNADKPIGRGVKGQAVLVEFEHDDTMPIIYHDGTYIVPHKANRIAIGSTSVNDWGAQAPDAFDRDDMDFYQKALKLMPSLGNAPIVDRWAAVRPRNTLEGRGTEPWFGPVPGFENLTALIGGFKITLGIAHIAEFV